MRHESLLQMIRSYRYPLHPTKAQEAILLHWLRMCCSLYNGALEERKSSWVKLKKGVSYLNQQRSLTIIRAQDPDFEAIPAAILRAPLKRLDRAYKAFFRRVKSGETPGFPRFKSSKRYDSFSLMGQFSEATPKAKGRSAQVRIPKLGLVKFNQYRPLKGKVRDILVKREADRWFVIFQCDLGAAPEVVVDPTKSVGIDLGLTHFGTLDDGTTISNPRFFKAGQDLLARRQCALQRKRKGSRSRQRAKTLVQRAHAHVKNQRLDHARKLAKSLFETNDIVCYEDLSIQEMISGPSRDGKYKLNLAKSIVDASWSITIHCLKCKAEEAGKLAVGVDPRGTTQRCSGCGTVVPKGLRDRVHDCPVCGLIMDRDQNAGCNIKALGLSAVSGLRSQPKSERKAA